MGDITQLLDSHRGGAPDAIDRLLEEIYPSIRRLAGKLLQGESGTPTLQPTVLAHEFALKLLGGSGERLVNRAHLMATAALEMRHTIARHAIRRRRRFSDSEREAKSDSGQGPNRELLLTLETALGRLEQLDPRAYHVVLMRFYGGLNAEETANELGVTTKTVQRDWVFASAWLSAELGDQ